MSDADIRAARDRIDTVEKRIAALSEAGVDVAALRAQLAFAHAALREGRLADVEAISDEVQSAARRLAELGGRSSPHPAQTRTPAHGTEALQRVKVQRAQLAEEVRAAIDAEVQSQMVPGAAGPVAVLTQRVEGLARRLAAWESRPQGADPGLAARLDHLAEQVATAIAPREPDQQFTAQLDRLAQQVAGLAVSEDDARMQAERLRSLEVRLAAAQTRPDQADPGLDRRLAAIEARLADLAGRQPADAGGLEQRLAALEQRPAATSAEVAGVVAHALEEAVPRQTGELMKEAMSRLPTRDDLAQIADTLRADLDWRLERAAAEHGWCSLADVQATVRKAIAEQDPGGGPAPSQLARLENALAEFVQHSREQQDRLINALAERVAQHTKSLTRRMLVRQDAGPAGRTHETEELSPSASESGHGSSSVLAITGAVDRPSGKSPTEAMLDPLPPEVLDRTRETHGITTRMTMRVNAMTRDPGAEVEMPSDQVAREEGRDEDERSLHDLVTAEVERALSSAVASTLAAPVEPPAVPQPKAPASPSDEAPTLAASPAEPGSATGLRALTTAAPTAPAPGLAEIAALVAAEVARQIASRPSGGGDPTASLIQALPGALRDPTVRTELFAVLALEAAGKPGALGELTGLRRFLKRELEAAAETVARRDTVPA